MSVAAPVAADSGWSSARLRRDPTLLDPVVARLHERVETGDLPAAALAIGDAAGEIRSEAFVARGRPLSPESMFFLASVTKPIFATAFMQLVEDGRLSLDDPIVRYIPDFANAPGKADVTPRHLLTHTSGVPDYTPEMIRKNRPSAAAMTRFAIDSPLTNRPGSRYEYCSASFYLLATIIERLTGTAHADYLRERVLQPLGMRTTYDPRQSGLPIVAVHGVGVDNRLTRFLVLRYLAATQIPGGGLFGTLDDLLRFGGGVLRPTRVGDRDVPLGRRSIEMMIEDQLGGVAGEFDGEPHDVYFGLGWGKPTLMRNVPGSPRVVSHGGATGTRLWIDPDAELVFVFFTNQWSPDRGPETEALEGTYAAMAVAPHSPRPDASPNR
jgi:CubicO group peptidase (beta-lactamase class C family)